MEAHGRESLEGEAGKNKEACLQKGCPGCLQVARGPAHRFPPGGNFI